LDNDYKKLIYKTVSMSQFFKINVSTVLFNEKREILIQKRSLDEEVYPGLWGIPGGTVETSDSSILDALKREVKEEVGLEISNIVFYKENLVSKEKYGVFYLVFISENFSGEAKALDGTSDVLWLEENNLNDYEFTPTTKETILELFQKGNSNRN